MRNWKKWTAAVLITGVLATQLSVTFSAVGMISPVHISAEVVTRGQEEEIPFQESNQDLEDSTASEADAENLTEGVVEQEPAEENDANDQEETSGFDKNAADEAEVEEETIIEDGDSKEEVSQEEMTAEDDSADSADRDLSSGDSTDHPEVEYSGNESEYDPAVDTASETEAGKTDAASVLPVEGAEGAGAEGELAPEPTASIPPEKMQKHVDKEGYTREMGHLTASDAPGVGNDDIFAAYVNRELKLEKDLMADTGKYRIQEPTKNSNRASNQLTGINRAIYGSLLEQIRMVAAGELTDTELYVTLGEIGIVDDEWSAADLGVSELVDEDWNVTEEAWEAFQEKMGYDPELIYDCLLADCPYDLYWHDKREGVSFSPEILCDCYYNEIIGDWMLYPTHWLEFSFVVAGDYSSTGELETFETDPVIGASVQEAKENAQAIVKKYRNKTDFQKLDAYRKEIQSRTSYNFDAIEDDFSPYIMNPWQLIWALDDDPDTKVVCEGYSKTYQYLCDLTTWTGIFRECISVTGDAFGGGHMWNIVILQDGGSYLADITNCDEGNYSATTGCSLFLVGIRSSGSTDQRLATGSVKKGYTFSGATTYVYDADTLDAFSQADLTLAEGRITSSTTATRTDTETHTHVYVTDPAEEPTCYAVGLTEGSHCAVCGYANKPQLTIEKTAHTPGTWKVKVSPTYDKTGTKTTTCTVCGETMTASIPKLIHVSGISMAGTASVNRGKTITLSPTVTPSNAANKAITWKSSNTKIATVSSTGVVKGCAWGKATITATTKDGSKTASCVVSVSSPVSGTTFEKWISDTTCRIAVTNLGAEKYQYMLFTTGGTKLKTETITTTYASTKGSTYRGINITGLRTNIVSGLRIRAYRNGVWGAWSNNYYIVQDPDVSFSQPGSARTAKLSWNRIAGAQNYVVQMTTNPSAAWEVSARTTGTSVTVSKYKKSGFKKYQNYYTRVLPTLTVRGTLFKLRYNTPSYYQLYFWYY